MPEGQTHGYGHRGLAGFDRLAVRVEQRARALRDRASLTGRDRGEDRVTAIDDWGRPLCFTLELRAGIIRQQLLRRLLLLLGVLEDMVHRARQLARHPHEGCALLLEEPEAPDDLVVRLGCADWSRHRQRRRDLELWHFLWRDIVDAW